MADNFPITPGTGRNAATDEVTYSGDTADVQLVRPVLTTGSEGSKTVVDIAGGGGTEATALRVTLANDSTGLVSVDDNGGSLTVDYATTGSGTATGALRVELPTDGTGIIAGITNVVHVDDNASTLSIDDGAGSITVDYATTGSGTATGALRVELANNGTGTLATVSTVTTCSTVTNLSQLGGQAVAMGTGTRSAGTQRVTIATDDVVPASQSGTWTVQPGNTANTTPWLVSDATRTSGGPTTYHLVSAGTTNATTIKASAGQLYGWFIYNSNSSARKLAFHNAASTPTAGASIYFTLMIPALSGANCFLTHGIPFSTGISITTVTGLADSDNTAVAANDLIINLWYA